MNRNAAPTAAKAFSYLRFSSPEQAKGASKKRQIDGAVRWAAEHGLELDEQLRDEGVSAFKGRHRDPTSALGKFLERVRMGVVPRGSFLIIESFDRLSREQVIDALELFLRLTGDGITIVTLTDGQIYNRESLARDSTQIIISIIIMSRAYEESATKSRRVGDAWSRKRAAARTDGQAMTARCPGWIKLVGGPRRGRYELIPERAEVVARIFEDTIAGDGRRTICKRLNASGTEPWGMGRSKGKYWHDSYVAKVLTSTASFGRYDKGDDRLADYFPAVVSEETYWRAQAATASRSAGGGKIAAGFGNLLKGLMRCSACQGAMAYVDKGKRSSPVLRCAAAHAKAGCGRRRAYPYSSLEMLVVHAYVHVADAGMFADGEIVKAAQAESAALELRRTAALARRDRLVGAIADGVPMEVIRATLDAAVAELAIIDDELDKARTLATPRDDDFEYDIEFRTDMVRDLIKARDPDERYRGRSAVNARLRHYLDHIDVEENGSVTYHFKPEYEGVTDRMLEIYSPKSDSELP